jgi:hypothetical protein
MNYITAINKLFGLNQKVTKSSRLNKNSLNTTSGFVRAARTVPQQWLVFHSVGNSTALRVLLAQGPP